MTATETETKRPFGVLRTPKGQRFSPRSMATGRGADPQASPGPRSRRAPRPGRRAAPWPTDGRRQSGIHRGPGRRLDRRSPHRPQVGQYLRVGPNAIRPLPTSGRRGRSATRRAVCKVGGEGASPQGLPDRHKSARWPYDLPAYSWTGASGPSPIRVQETRARSPTARPRPIREIPADSRCPAGKVDRGRGTPARVGESHRPFGLSVPRVEFLSGR
jgi:hypothetical protein